MSDFTTRPEIRGTFGVATSTHWIASAVGMSLLEKGGTAFDAAAGMGFALHVVEPHLNGPLGDMPALIDFVVVDNDTNGKPDVTLLAEKDYVAAREALTRAMDAPARPDHPEADFARKLEVENLLASLEQKL